MCEEMESSDETPSTQMCEEIESIDQEMESSIKNYLFIMAMKVEWDKVVDACSNPEAHKVKITRSGDTALHIAVSDGKEEIVKKLID
ncbi:hypothetical protein SLA2020_283010 [Shorea laevis]